MKLLRAKPNSTDTAKPAQAGGSSPEWSVDQFGILDRDETRFHGRIIVLDALTSVHAAVEKLNQGMVS